MKKALLLVALCAAPACAAPSSFDGVTGGAKEENGLAAPRPVSPISVSMVSTSRPHFTWALGPGLTGAVVELSRTRAFDGDIHSFTGRGESLTVGEDLEPGIWFWRLTGTRDAAVGTKPGPVWEVLVRGPAAHGENASPSRSLVDMNGDGQPDLMVAATVVDGAAPVPAGTDPGAPTATGTTPPPAPPTAAVVLFYAGDATRGYARSGQEGILGTSNSTYLGPISIGAGTDLDGDGYTDLVEAGSYTTAYEGKTWFDTTLTYSTAGRAEVTFDMDRGGLLYTGAVASAVPSVREGGDVDGDGYGDALLGMDDVGFVMLGSMATLSTAPAFLPVAPGLRVNGTGTTRVAFGGFDANGDGLADVAFSYASEYEPTARAFVAPGDRGQRLRGPRMLDVPDARRASAFTAGDFDGDGLDDLAVTTPLSDASRVCVWYGHRDRLLAPGPCVVAAAGDADFGGSLTAVDLEGDGVDELLLTVTTGGIDGVRVVRLGGEGAVASPVGEPGLGGRLTTIWPGRPGKARWAAAAADGTRIGIYEGETLKETLSPPPGAVSGFGRGLR